MYEIDHRLLAANGRLGELVDMINKIGRPEWSDTNKDEIRDQLIAGIRYAGSRGDLRIALLLDRQDLDTESRQEVNKTLPSAVRLAGKYGWLESVWEFSKRTDLPPQVRAQIDPALIDGLNNCADCGFWIGAILKLRAEVRAGASASVGVKAAIEPALIRAIATCGYYGFIDRIADLSQDSNESVKQATVSALHIAGTNYEYRCWQMAKVLDREGISRQFLEGVIRFCKAHIGDCPVGTEEKIRALEQKLGLEGGVVSASPAFERRPVPIAKPAVQPHQDRIGTAKRR